MKKANTTKRILALDLLRGYFLCVITLDHIYRFPGLFEFFTGRGQLWVSAAEGFFIISGILIGLIYGPRFKENPTKASNKIWKRALKLYICSIALTLLFTAWGQHMPAVHIKPGIWNGSAPSLLLSTISLRYVYGWADFLPYYIVFLVFTPFVLATLSKKKTSWLLIASLLLWLIRGTSFYLAWQILFLTGIIVGYNFVKIEGWLKNLKASNQKRLKQFIFLATAASILLSTYFVFAIKTKSPLLEFIFDKNTLGPGRFALSWLWFISFFLVFKKNEKTINHFTAGALKSLGENSLLTYSIQAIVVFPIESLIPITTSLYANIVINICVLVALYFLTTKAKSFLLNRNLPNLSQLPVLTD